MEEDKNVTGKIFYGFDRNYLKDWDMNAALREIYQNFLDYGDYDEDHFIEVDNNGDELMYISVQNDWVPASLDFLRIGNSRKGDGAIGKHGEGLKMAFLIFHRMGFESKILTPTFVIYPEFYTDPEIGECFSLVYKEHGNKHQKFSVEFTCTPSIFNAFKANLVYDSDVVYDDAYHGQIVNKPIGNIYSGKLFVCHIDNISKSYNIDPRYLPLDRDRQVPQSHDVSWATSKILGSYGKWTTKDVSCSDTMYIDKIPDDIKDQFEPTIIGNSVKFVMKDEAGVTQVVPNGYINEALKRDSFFSGVIKRLKMFMAKQLGLYDLLIEFRHKHVHGLEAESDFNIILERVAGEVMEPSEL